MACQLRHTGSRHGTPIVDYFVYFVGPFVVGYIGVRLMRERAAIFGAGLLTFFVAWVVMQTVGGIAPAALGYGEKSVGYSLIVATLAAVCEEPARYFVFRHLRCFRGNHTWSASLTYALGHHGMESIIVGLNLVLIVLVVTHRPDLLSDPGALEESQAVLGLGLGAKLYNAFERLLVGLLIHACFSAVVMLSVASGRTRWLGLAMVWHFAHNMVGFTLQRLPASDLIGKLWIGVIVVGYSYLLAHLYRRLRRFAPANPEPPPAPVHPPLILPGRSG